MIDNVTIVSMEDGALLDARAVLIGNDGRIAEIGAVGSVASPRAKHIDGTGKFLMPGLVDMHVHLTGKDDFDYFLTHGVTRIREARGTDRNLGYRDAIAQGSLRGPLITQGSPFVWDRGPALLANPPENPAHVRELIRRFNAEGYDAIKLVDSYDAGTTLALMDEAMKVGIPVFGHVPDDSENFDWEWTAGLGMRSIEHLDEVANLAFENNPTPSEERIDWFVEVAKRNHVAFGSVLGAMILRQTAHDRMDAGQEPFEDGIREHLFEAYGWTAVARFDRTAQSFSSSTPEARATQRRSIPVMEDVLVRLTHSGLMVVPGTEGTSALRVAGVNLLHELDLFVDAGLTPYEALRAATLYAARVLGNDHEEGLVKEGYRANLVLLGANPLEGLDALRVIAGVSVAGRWYGEEMLAAMRRGF